MPHTLVAVFSVGGSCFDFGRPTSPVKFGCFHVIDMTGYTSGYGRLSKHSLESGVRGWKATRC